MTFKAGDKVRIVRCFDDEEFPKVGWNSDMFDDVGRVLVVKSVHDIDGTMCCDLGDNGESGSWAWPFAVLELRERFVDPTIQAEADAIIRDAMRYRWLRSNVGKHQWHCSDWKVDELVDRLRT